MNHLFIKLLTKSRQIMIPKINVIKLALLFIGILFLGCCQGNLSKDTDDKSARQPVSPRYQAHYDRAKPPIPIDIESALHHPTGIKLSKIASKLEYYNVGDARYTVTQAIAIPDSGAFITFNNPRIYYRKRGTPSKRYGFKALDYKWNNEINGLNLFYDKKTTRMYCALSGLDQDNKEDSTASKNVRPCIGELPPLDTMLTIRNYIFPENLPAKFPINAPAEQIVGFSSSGYTLCQYEAGSKIPNGVISFNLRGDTLCKFLLTDTKALTAPPDTITKFQTFYWNTNQDRMNFMIPYCDTVYQLSGSHTIAPLYALQKDNRENTTGLRTFLENPKGVFMGLYQKDSPKIHNWLGWLDEYKPIITNRVVYLKNEGKTYSLPSNSGGFINDIDDGLPFWPDGQTDDCIYMIRTVTEMRETVKRPGSPRQKDLIKFLDDPKVFDRDYVMIVARP